MSQEEIKNIERVKKENNMIFMEAFMYQFHKQHSRVKELLSQQVIGDIVHAKAHFSWYLDDPDDIRMNPKLGGGALWDVGCYGIHAITQIVGLDPIDVSMTGIRDQEKGIDTLSTCVFTDAKGWTAEVTSSFSTPFINYYEIIGSKGSILVESAFRPDISPDGLGKVIVKGNHSQNIQYETFADDQYLKQIEHFHDCIMHKKEPSYTISDSFKVISCIEKSYESLNEQSVKKKIEKDSLISKI